MAFMTLMTHALYSYYFRFLHVKKLKKCDRNLCVQCGLLLLPGETDEHEGQGHSIKKFITKQMLRRPTELFAPLDNNKTYAVSRTNLCHNIS